MRFRKLQALEQADRFDRFFCGLLGIEAQVFQQDLFAAPMFGQP